MAGQTVDSRSSPFIPMFEHFRSELDEHHDRRERVIKASRDITAASKKIIFALQRVHTIRAPIPLDAAKTVSQHGDAITKSLAGVAQDLQGINAHRYGRNISGGIQEYMEALTFRHYVEEQQLLDLRTAETKLNAFVQGGTQPVQLTEDDYLGGVFDMTGELMRFAITSMATSGNLSGKPIAQGGTERSTRTVVSDLQTLSLQLGLLDAGSNGLLARDMSKKLDVTHASVEKVEKAQYNLVVRGSERPEGWMPDLRPATQVPFSGETEDP